MKMNMKCIWGIVIGFFIHTGREWERGGNTSKCVSVCGFYLEVLHERPWVLDSVVFLQMEHPQIQQRQTAVTMETKPLEKADEATVQTLFKAPLFYFHVVHTQRSRTSNTPSLHGLRSTSSKRSGEYIKKIHIFVNQFIYDPLKRSTQRKKCFKITAKDKGLS